MSDMLTTRARLPRYQPLSLALVTAAGLSILAAIVIELAEIPPVTASWCALLVLLLASGAVFLWQQQKITSGIQDLVINHGSHTVELPLTYKRRARLPLPFASIKAVALKKVAHQRRSGISYTYAPTLQLRDGSSECLTDLNKRRAEAFAKWLREKLNLPAATD